MAHCGATSRAARPRGTSAPASSRSASSYRPRPDFPSDLRGEVALAITADAKGAHGIAAVRGAGAGMPETDATIAFDTDWHTAELAVLASGSGDARVAALARGSRTGDRIEVSRAHVTATGRDLTAATGGLVALTGRELVADVDLSKPATIALTKNDRVLDLEFEGSARGTRIAYSDVRVASADATFHGTLSDVFRARGRARVNGAWRAGSPLGSATVDAEYLPDGRIWTHVDARPAMAAVTVRASAYTTLGEVTTIALGNHSITPVVGATWRGRGGTITIGDDIRVRGFTTSSGSGHARIDATVGTGWLTASVDANALPLNAIDPALAGTVSGRLAIERRGLRWKGGGDLAANGVVIDPARPTPFGGHVHVGVDGRIVSLDVRADDPAIGGARLEVEVEGPRDLTDVAGWRRLERSALHTVAITADNIRLDELSPTGGRIKGKLVLGATEFGGTLDVGGVDTPLGLARGNVTFSPLGDDLYASWNAMLSDVGEANVGLRIALPKHPFDPAAWKTLGRGVVRSLTASFDDLAVDPAKLAKLGIEANYSARADISLAVGAAATEAKLNVDLRDLTGGDLTQPINAHVEATTNAMDTTASACVARASKKHDDACKARGLGVASIRPRLIELTGVRIPVTFSTWLAAPKSALKAPISGALVIPTQSAPAFFAVFGRRDFDPREGRLAGQITIDGILTRPTANGTFSLEKLRVRSDIAGRTMPTIERVTLGLEWNGRAGTVDLKGVESNGGKLHVYVAGEPARWEQAAATLSASRLDLAPFTAFLTGALHGAKGILHATVTVNGFDLATSRIRGDLHLVRANVPINPVVGTLRDATMNVLMSDKGIKLDARGLLNGCRDPDNPTCKQNVRLDASAPGDLSKIDGTLVATKVSTIGEIEPIIDGKAKLALRRTGGQLTGDIYLTDASIVVPESTGEDLLDFETPDDVYFIENPPKEVKLAGARAPTKAWFDARIHIASTPIDVLEYGVKGSIVAHRPLRVQLGDSIGLDGKISVEYGSADDIFGHQYEISPTDLVSFDGTIDPTIDLEMTHSFRDFTMLVRAKGRLSDPDFPKLTFSAEPAGNYTESELFGFFLGGEPGGEASSQAADAAVSAAASVASQKIARFVKKRLGSVLPSKLKLPDVLKCEPTTTASAGSCTLGYRFLNGRMFVAVKKAVTPLPNENGEELQVQYYLSRHWYLEGVVGRDGAGASGADLLWHGKL